LGCGFGGNIIAKISIIHFGGHNINKTITKIAINTQIIIATICKFVHITAHLNFVVFFLKAG